jgi:hypothetical protein
LNPELRSQIPPHQQPAANGPSPEVTLGLGLDHNEWCLNQRGSLGVLTKKETTFQFSAIRPNLGTAAVIKTD